MGLERVAAPALEPVSLEEAKEHIRVMDQTQDGLVDVLIVAAREMAETLSGGRQYITAQWKSTLCMFPYCGGMIELPKPPLQSVESIKYVDMAGTLQTLSPSVYQVVTSGQVGAIVTKYGQFWPDTREEADAVRIEFTAGYGDEPEDVPATIRHAVKLLVGHLYENREPVVVGSTPAEIPMTARALLAATALVPIR